MAQNLADDKDSLLSFSIITCYMKSRDNSIDCWPNQM